MSHKGILFAAAAALMSLPALSTANAEVAPALYTPQTSSAALTQVQYYYGYSPYYYGDGSLGIPGDIVGGILGGWGQGYGYGYAGGGMAACTRTFRSFNPATGTYTTYSGQQVLCPYLGG